MATDAFHCPDCGAELEFSQSGPQPERCKTCSRRETNRKAYRKLRSDPGSLKARRKSTTLYSKASRLRTRIAKLHGELANVEAGLRDDSD